ncbi:MAG: hypothetical protein R3320_10555 [Nitriliruptorales bacterium]|nr:hypothetical protein [Nitriliruptorales bacterium]
MFQTRDSWRVDYNYPDGSHYAFVVCRSCADDLRPVRLTIDLAALRDYDGPRDLSAVTSLVETITSQREQPTDGVLPLRWSDVHLLAETYDESPSEFAARLHNAGVSTPQPDQ